MGIGFEDLYCKYFARIKNFANIYLKDNDDATSVTQDVFMNIYENRQNFTFDDTLLPYIYVLTKNRCLNILKKAQAKKRYQKDKLYQFNIDLSIEALKHNNLDYTKLQEKYYKILNSLPQNTKDTFLLSRDKQLTYKEISDIQKISVKTVEYRIMHTLKILREGLKEYHTTIILFFLYGIIDLCCI